MQALLWIYHARKLPLFDPRLLENLFKELTKEKMSPLKTYPPRSFAEEFVIPDLDEYINPGSIHGRALNENYLMETSKRMVEGDNLSIEKFEILSLFLYI
jgi:hypothetical protein